MPSREDTGWMVAGAVLLLVALPVALNRPRGIRNNNPGNLRPLPNGQQWAGQTGLDTGSAGPYVVFGRAVDGIRALARLLLNYQRTHGLATTRAIINRYAPPSENDPNSYALAVARQVGLPGPDAPVDLVNNNALHLAFVKAVIKHENGVNPYPEALVSQGVEAGRA